MPCRGRKRNTRSATSMCGCCAAAPGPAVVPAWRQRLAGLAAGVRSAVQAVRGVRARAPGFGTSDNPAWLRNIADLAMYYLDFLDEFGPHEVHVVGQSLGGWAAAEAAVRNCSRIKTLSLLGPAGIRIKGMPSGDNFIWGPEEGIRNLYHNQAIPDQILAVQPTTSRTTSCSPTATPPRNSAGSRDGTVRRWSAGCTASRCRR